jgi:hypothetical protein
MTVFECHIHGSSDIFNGMINGRTKFVGQHTFWMVSVDMQYRCIDHLANIRTV